jgi:hypothetical protein
LELKLSLVLKAVFSQLWAIINGVWIVDGFIGHFNTQSITAINYSTITDLHNLQITTTYAKSFQSAVIPW